MNIVSAGSSRPCSKCGEPAAADAAFCRHCGSRLEDPTPDAAPSPPGPRGPVCPHCEAEIRPGSSFCRFCGAAIDAEQPGQPMPSGAAVQATQPTTAPTLSATSPPAAPARPAQPHTAAAPAAPRSGHRAALAITAGLLAIGAGAAAAIVLLGGGSDKAGVTRHDSRAAAIVPAAGAPRRTGQTSMPTEHAGFPPETKAQMAQEIQAMLLSFHQDVVDRRFDAAWALLSARKRGQSLREYGYAKWERNQATLSPFLDPSGLAVRIEALEGEGVARVLVTGMGWSKPGASCTQWSGLTWVKYENGEWTYDPGYSTTAARQREWEPRYRELLGARC